MIGRVRRPHFEPESTEELAKNENADTYETPRTKQAETLLELQTLFDTHARDILDESDDVLRPKFQLIYAIGDRHPFEGSPDRWLIIQQVLELVKQHAHSPLTADSRTMRYDDRSPGSFPHIQVEDNGRLISLIVEEVLSFSTLGLHSKLAFKQATHEFIVRKDIPSKTVEVVENFARQSTSWSSLLLLRGLFAHNILLFALTQHRWRVDYGLDPNHPPRTMLAIPYRAKDVPAEAAEFGHPDMTIMLTCLSYYYRGLTEEELRTSFELLLQEHNPPAEYARWLEGYDTASAPDVLQKLSSVNISSFEQWKRYFYPLFARNKRAIDLYLSKIVFPNHAEEFPQKILGSYWDIAEEKDCPVTGGWRFKFCQAYKLNLRNIRTFGDQ